MEWRPAGWSVYVPLLIFPCTIKSRSSLLALVHPGGPGKKAVKWLWWYQSSNQSDEMYIEYQRTRQQVIQRTLSRRHFPWRSLFYILFLVIRKLMQVRWDQSHEREQRCQSDMLACSVVCILLCGEKLWETSVNETRECRWRLPYESPTFTRPPK